MIKPEVIKTFGRAGTGKTTYLLKQLEKQLSNGVHPVEVGMISHTNAAVDVFKARAIKQGNYKEKDFPYFRTLHSLCYQLIGLKEYNHVDREVINRFIDEYYPDMYEKVEEYDPDVFYLTHEDKERLKGSSRIKALIEIDSVLRNCLIYDFDFDLFYKKTGRTLMYTRYQVKKTYFDEKMGKYRIQWEESTEYLSPEEVKEFSTNWKEYMERNEIFDFTRMLEEAYFNSLVPSVKYLFVDEFQDYSELQYRIYELWRDNGDIKKIWLAGDDCQVINRHAGASAEFMLSTYCTEKVLLDRNYRFGKVIYENAQKYIELLSKFEPINVECADKPGKVIRCYGEEWLDYVDFKNDETSVLVLAATSEWAKRLISEIKEICPDVYFQNLGDPRKVDKVFERYNVIAALERGEEVEWERIKKLFTGSDPIPTSTLEKKTIVSLDGVERTEVKKKRVFKNIKKKIREGRFEHLDYYDKTSFRKDFLANGWNGKQLVSMIPDIDIFPAALDVFPEYVSPKVNKRYGTIHKAKGDQAEIVFLGMAVPFPSYERINETEVADDVLRQFYVGTTRPESVLIEIYEYLEYSNGEPAPAPLDVINRGEAS